MEVINEDYNDFVSLSTKLVNVDGAVLRMQRPLQEVAERLGAVRAGLQGELNALGEGLRKRQETAAARTLLELMQDTAHTMSKVSLLSCRCISQDRKLQSPVAHLVYQPPGCISSLFCDASSRSVRQAKK